MAVPHTDNLPDHSQLQLGPTLFGSRITPYMMIVPAGEDIAMKIMSFSRQNTHGICVLSATGWISQVTFHQPGNSGDNVTHKGRFQLLSLSGSFITCNGVENTKSGAVSVFLVGSEGRVVGGVLAGLLIAASPVQILMGSFSFDQDHREGEGGGEGGGEGEGEGDDDESEVDQDEGESEGEDENGVTSTLEPNMDMDEDEGKDGVTSKLEPKMDVDEEDKGEFSG
ncbi:hypothetical protein KSS87_018068 [Heliosperma pusillum]|nr:hypothetical protein KSS87_018068 [Heliosperma pusillum]